MIPSPSVKIQNYWRKSLLEVIRQNIAGWCQQTFCFQSLLTMPSNVLPLHLKQTFPSIIWIFTEGESDEIKSRLPFKIFSTLKRISTDYEMLAQPCKSRQNPRSIYQLILPPVHDGRITFTSGMIFVRTIESRYTSSQISL